MADEIVKLSDIISAKDSYDDVKRVGILYQKKTVESILAFARVVYILKKKCEADEKDFGSTCTEFFGLSSSGASQFAKTGEHAEKLFAYAQNLPPSSRTLYELTQLSINDLDKHVNVGDINPNSTVNDVKALKDTLKDAKKSKKKQEKDSDNPFAVEAEDQDGNPVDAELVDDSEGGEEDSGESKPKSKNKMSMVEALAIFDIDMNEVYMTKVQKGDTEKELLDKAFYIITGERL